MSSLGSGCSPCPLNSGPQAYIAVSRFLFGAGDLNSAPHIFTFAEQILLHTEQSLLSSALNVFKRKRDWEHSSVLECLPDMDKALGSILSTMRNINKRQKLRNFPATVYFGP